MIKNSRVAGVEARTRTPGFRDRALAIELLPPRVGPGHHEFRWQVQCFRAFRQDENALFSAVDFFSSPPALPRCRPFAHGVGASLSVAAGALVVGFAAGGGNDIVARLIGQWLSERLGQPFVIENRPGAGTNIATEAVVRAPPDGYTLLLDRRRRRRQRDALRQAQLQFHARHRAGREHQPRQPWSWWSTLRFRPRPLPSSSPTPRPIPARSTWRRPASAPRPFAGELFKMMAGVNMVHVPYRGDAPALTDLIGGQVQVMFVSPVVAIEHIRTGKLRALAVTTSTRWELLPDVPTVADFVPGYEASDWFGVGAPRDTPAEIVDKLNREINAGARRSEDASARLPISAARRSRARRPTSASSSPTKPRNGPRWSSLPASSRSRPCSREIRRGFQPLFWRASEPVRCIPAILTVPGRDRISPSERTRRACANPGETIAP